MVTKIPSSPAPRTTRKDAEAEKLQCSKVHGSKGTHFVGLPSILCEQNAQQKRSGKIAHDKYFAPRNPSRMHAASTQTLRTTTNAGTQHCSGYRIGISETKMMQAQKRLDKKFDERWPNVQSENRAFIANKRATSGYARLARLRFAAAVCGLAVFV